MPREPVGSDVGLMSVAVLALTLGMAVHFIRFFVRHARKDSRADRR